MNELIKSRKPILAFIILVSGLGYAVAQDNVVVVPLGGPDTLEVLIQNQQESVGDNASFSIFAPACPANSLVTGGGFLSSGFSDNFYAGSRPANFNSFAIVDGVNAADSWLCQGRNASGSSSDVTCFVICTSVL